MTSKADSFSECIEKIEAAYEYMLAYAAQGRDREPQGQSPSIRDFVTDLFGALGALDEALKTAVAAVAPGPEASAALLELGLGTSADAQRARQIIAVALSAPALSSQLIDNVNAAAHLRCVLTDIFVLDEAIQQHHRAALATPAG